MPATTEDGREWDVALKDLAEATSIQADFYDVTFAEDSFNRALGLALQAGGASTGSVAVLLDGCTLQDQSFDAAAVAEIPGSRQWTITLKDTRVVGNTLNTTGAVAVQESADVTLKLLSSSARLAGCSTVHDALPCPAATCSWPLRFITRFPVTHNTHSHPPLPLQPSPTTGWACWAPPRWAPPAAPASSLPSGA